MPTSMHTSYSNSSVTPQVNGRAVFQPLACSLCTKRKVRCDKKYPCTYCVQHELECIPQDQTRRARRRREQPDSSRLDSFTERFEAKTKSQSDSDDHPRKRNRGGSPKPLTTSSDPQGEFIQLQDLLEGVEQADGTSSSTDESYKFTISDLRKPLFMARWYDSVFTSDGEELLRFDDHCPNQHLTSFTAAQVFKLWRVYLESVHPIVQLIDKTTMQEKLLQYGDCISNATLMDQALILSVMTLALSAMDWRNIPDHFGGRNYLEVITTAQRATQTALHRIHIWKTSRWEAVQVLVIYLSGLHRFVDPRVLSAHIGMADRVARRMGMHRDDRSSDSNMKFKELKRKIWWELHLLDRRCNEKFGAGASVLGDSSLVPLPYWNESQELSEAALKASDTTSFVATKLAFCQFYAKLRRQQGPVVGQTEGSQWQASLESKLNEIKALQDDIMHRQQLVMPTAPGSIDRLAIVVTRLHLARLRMLAYTGPRQMRSEKDILTQCIHQIECDNEWRLDDEFETFKWFMSAYLPLLAYIYALVLIRKQPAGELVQWGWGVLQRVPWLSLGLRNRLDFDYQEPKLLGISGALFGPLLLRAWDTHNHSGFQEPSCISPIRQQIQQSFGADFFEGTTNSDLGSSSSDFGGVVCDVDSLLCTQIPEDWWTWQL